MGAGAICDSRVSSFPQSRRIDALRSNDTLERLRAALRFSRSRALVRRYFVVNGFDGALTMLGLITGFRLGGEVDLGVVIGACLGAAVALGVSGVTSAYLSEAAERRRSLAELEGAMVADLSESVHADAARLVPLLIAAVNGASPVLLSLIIIAPLWLARAGVPLPLEPLSAAIATAFLCIFSLGVFLGRVGGTSLLASGVKTLLIALVTVGLILIIDT
jgi:predicted membrane protein (TIGR00267 family)